MVRVTNRELFLHDRFVEAGLHDKGAAAPIGNFVQETGSEDLDTTMFRAHPDASGGVRQDLKSGGLAEWLGDRKTAYIKFSRAREAAGNLPGGSLLNDLATQGDFVLHELESEAQYAELYKQLTTDTGRSVASLTANFMETYEKPSNKLNAKGERIDGLDNRIKHANAVYERVQLIRAAEGQPTPIPVPQPAPTTGGTAPWAPPGPQVHIDPPIQTGGAPARPTPGLIPASLAGYQAAVLDNLWAIRADYIAKIAVVDAMVEDFKKLGPIPTINAPLALPKPIEPTNKGKNMTANIGDGSGKAALASTGVWGGLISAGIPVLSAFSDYLGHSVDPRLQMAGSLIGGLLSIYGRVSATVPITGVLKP